MPFISIACITIELLGSSYGLWKGMIPLYQADTCVQNSVPVRYPGTVPSTDFISNNGRLLHSIHSVALAQEKSSSSASINIPTISNTVVV